MFKNINAIVLTIKLSSCYVEWFFVGVYFEFLILLFRIP